MKWLDEVERQYRVHKKTLHGLTGISIAMLVALYFYSKYKQQSLIRDANE